MKKWLLCAAVLLSASPELSHKSAAAQLTPRILIRFTSMYGVDGPFVGDANPIRGIPGDELPWQIRSVDGTVWTDGSLAINVRGLVFPNDPVVPPNLRGINDEDHFRAGVSCLTENGNSVATVNTATLGAPASRTGDAFIAAKIKLPNPCVAPIVFILGGDEDHSLAISGNEN
jgi:hypothetical protein